ncbi:hypothetical protein [uncultured Massilia sp.]|uniref:hypothetical protein n=1 Tax=uncultured Massilia sp. TaxID=169973 RepID=UPI0025D46CC8|nr:hypothetical protein [uncultured Massilia sp.]
MTIPAHAASCAAEPIDVVRIRLTRRASATVVVSEFRMANRVLAGWADEAAPACRDVQVDYDIVFFDGYRLRGCHDLLRRGRSHVSLSRVVRRLFKAMAQGASMASAALAEPSRYLVDG